MAESFDDMQRRNREIEWSLFASADISSPVCYRTWLNSGANLEPKQIFNFILSIYRAITDEVSPDNILAELSNLLVLDQVSSVIHGNDISEQVRFIQSMLEDCEVRPCKDVCCDYYPEGLSLCRGCRFSSTYPGVLHHLQAEFVLLRGMLQHCRDNLVDTYGGERLFTSRLDCSSGQLPLGRDVYRYLKGGGTSSLASLLAYLNQTPDYLRTYRLPEHLRSLFFPEGYDREKAWNDLADSPAITHADMCDAIQELLAVSSMLPASDIPALSHSSFLPLLHHYERSSFTGETSNVLWLDQLSAAERTRFVSSIKDSGIICIEPVSIVGEAVPYLLCYLQATDETDLFALIQLYGETYNFAFETLRYGNIVKLTSQPYLLSGLLHSVTPVCADKKYPCYGVKSIRSLAIYTDAYPSGRSYLDICRALQKDILNSGVDESEFIIEAARSRLITDVMKYSYCVYGTAERCRWSWLPDYKIRNAKFQERLACFYSHLLVPDADGIISLGGPVLYHLDDGGNPVYDSDIRDDIGYPGSFVIHVRFMFEEKNPTSRSRRLEAAYVFFAALNRNRCLDHWQLRVSAFTDTHLVLLCPSAYDEECLDQVVLSLTHTIYAMRDRYGAENGFDMRLSYQMYQKHPEDVADYDEEENEDVATPGNAEAASEADTAVVLDDVLEDELFDV